MIDKKIWLKALVRTYLRWEFGIFRVTLANDSKTLCRSM